MSIPRYRYLPVKGGLYRLIAEDVPPRRGGGPPGTGPLRAVTTVDTAATAAHLAGYLNDAAERSFLAAVGGELPDPPRRPAPLPAPVVRATDAEVTGVAERLIADRVVAGSAPWLVRDLADAGAPPLMAGPVAVTEDSVTRACGSCPCLTQLTDALPPGGVAGWMLWTDESGAWERWAAGCRTVERVWLEAVGDCDEPCRCHGVGSVLPGDNPLAARLAAAGRTWVGNDETRHAALFESDLMGLIRSDTVTGAQPRIVLPPGRRNLLHAREQRMHQWWPVLVATDAQAQVQRVLGVHPDVPGGWFLTWRKVDLTGIWDDGEGELGGHVARTAPTDYQAGVWECLPVWTDFSAPGEVDDDVDDGDPDGADNPDTWPSSDSLAARLEEPLMLLLDDPHNPQPWPPPARV